MRKECKILCIVLSVLGTGLIFYGPVKARVGAYMQNNPAQVQSLSAEIYREFLAKRVVPDSASNPEVETINRICRRLIAAVKQYHTDKRSTRELEGFAWEYQLVEERKKDAWCLPGGKIAVYTSLLPITQSDASLACVIGHEISHIFLKHGDQRIKQYLKEYLGEKDLAAAISAKPLETKDFFKMAYGNGDYVGVIRGFSTDNEREADKLGAIFCAMAGYDPEVGIVFWERMQHLQWSGRQPELLSTHPYDEKRAGSLKESMDEILKYYQKPIKKK